MINEGADPYIQPSFSLGNRLGRALWQFVWLVFFRLSPRPFHSWRKFLLKIFGARIGDDVHIYPGAKIWAPWNLVCEDMVAIANGANIYNPSVIHLGSHSIVSQDAFLCGASHAYDDPAFPLYSKPIVIGRYAWVCARACVMPGVTIADGAILGLASVATRDLPEWSIWAGSPCRQISLRRRIPLESKHI